MSFPLIGNLNVNTAVCAAIKERRLPHALLIEGESGTGKHTLSQYIAKAAVCGGENPPCGECRSCHLADVGSHPDISALSPADGKKNITVGQIRILRSEAYVKPHMAGKRVFIIDRADTMNEQAQNALLKVLEEPPESVIFILTAQSKSALLDTVISRCTLLSLYPPEGSAAEEYIKNTGKYTDEEIRSALLKTRNNIGQALCLLSGGEDSAEQAKAREFLRFMLSGNEFGMLKILAAYEKDRVGADKFFKELKYQTACLIRERRENIGTAKALNAFYGEFSRLEESLNTNTNLSLLFSAVASKAYETVRNHI